MGATPTEEELFQLISSVDEDLSGSIDFQEFLKIVDDQKTHVLESNFNEEEDFGKFLWAH